jgi:hypothetical protein
MYDAAADRRLVRLIMDEIGAVVGVTGAALAEAPRLRACRGPRRVIAAALLRRWGANRVEAAMGIARDIMVGGGEQLRREVSVKSAHLLAVADAAVARVLPMASGRETGWDGLRAHAQAVAEEAASSVGVTVHQALRGQTVRARRARHDIVRRLCAEGYTNVAIGEALGFSPCSIRTWRRANELQNVATSGGRGAPGHATMTA